MGTRGREDVGRDGDLGREEEEATGDTARLDMEVKGGAREKDGVQALEKVLGQAVPERVAAYFEAWSERASWGEVYAAGLH